MTLLFQALEGHPAGVALGSVGLDRQWTEEGRRRLKS